VVIVSRVPTGTGTGDDRTYGERQSDRKSLIHRSGDTTPSGEVIAISIERAPSVGVGQMATTDTGAAIFLSVLTRCDVAPAGSNDSVDRRDIASTVDPGPVSVYNPSSLLSVTPSLVPE
jgi:hypothetical protein